MKKIIFIIFVFLLSSCINTPQKASKRINELIKQFPTSISIDTVTQIDTFIVYSEIEKIIESKDKQKNLYTTIDSLLNILEYSKDTVLIEKIRYKIKNNCTIENLINPFVFDTSFVSVMVTPYKNKIILKALIKEKRIEKRKTNNIIINTEEKPFYENSWFFYFIGSLSVNFLLLYLIGRKK